MLFVICLLNVLLIGTVSTEQPINESLEVTTTVLISNEENEESTTIPSVSDGKNVTENQINLDQIGPIISQLMRPIESTIQPYLGPLAPLSTILGQVITNTVTEVVVSLLNDTVASVRRQEFSEYKDYTAYLVNIFYEFLVILFIYFFIDIHLANRSIFQTMDVFYYFPNTRH